MYCDPNSFGGSCDVACIESNTCSAGFYTCDAASGSKVCKDGWIGTECKERAPGQEECPVVGGGSEYKLSLKYYLKINGLLYGSKTYHLQVMCGKFEPHVRSATYMYYPCARYLTDNCLAQLRCMH